MILPFLGFFQFVIYIYIEKIDGASSARMEKCLNPDSNRDPPAYAADDAPSIFQYSILLHFNQFISSLAALVWESDRGGPVGEAEKAKVASVSRT